MITYLLLDAPNVLLDIYNLQSLILTMRTVSKYFAQGP